MAEKKNSKNSDKIKYSSPIAETVVASGNFLNNVQNSGFITTIITLLGIGFILYKAVYVISDSLKSIAIEVKEHAKQDENQTILLNNLIIEIKENNKQDEKQLEIVQKILNSIENNNLKKYRN